MVENMFSNSYLHVLLWMYALKNAIYFFNKVPSKVVQMNFFKL